MNTLLIILAAAVLIATILPIVRHDAWWIRILDFPRIQIVMLGALVLAAIVLLGDDSNELLWVAATALAASIAYHGYRILPFSPLWRKQVPAAAKSTSNAGVSIVVANVLMENRDSDRLMEIIRSRNPDIVLAVETDEWWVDRFRGLEDSLPFTMYVPQSNTYGMVFMSRYHVDDLRVDRLVENDVPSVHATLTLPRGFRVRFYGLHPRPPHPKWGPSTVPRDAEILIVGRDVAADSVPTIVAGDLNDVAWSHTTRLFQRISGLVDPRRGRGMFNTFHADLWFARWPLDHIFHSAEFQLATIERLPAFGSDHFPVFAQLVYDSGHVPPEKTPAADDEDMDEAEEKIGRAFAGETEAS